MDNNNNTSSQKLIAGAIIVVGVLIAGAILLKGKTPTTPSAPTVDDKKAAAVQIDPVVASDYVLGDANAKVTFVEYADFQCPFCGRFFTQTTQPLIEKYVKTGKVQFIYRDFAFLGPESIKSAEAARCAGDQNKYWDYHDYLFTHQNGENKGGFADKNLKAFAKTLGLDTTAFNQCLDSGKYTQAVNDATTNAGKVGVQGTPKSFILKNGKVVDTVDGALPFTDPNPLYNVSLKIDNALK